MRNVSMLMKAIMAATALLIVTIVAAPPSFAAPKLEVSASQGLTDGQKIDVSGAGFKANLSQIAVGQCIDGMKGPTDCNLQGGATFRNADGSGSIGSFSIVVKEKFGPHDCTKVKCVIGAAPLPTAVDAATVSANEVFIPITFGAAAEEPAAEVPAGDDAGERQEAAEELPKTGVADSLPVIMVGGLVLLVAGAALRFGTRQSGSRA